MKSKIKITNHAQAAVIDIEGVIGVPEKMQFERPEQKVATYEAFSRSLEAIAQLDAPQVVVNIRSTGGDVNDALLIYEALSGLGGEVTTRCMGYVASAATIIAQAASAGRREISASALYLVHCSESAAEGNSRELSCAKDMLEATDRRIAGIYAARSGRPAAEFETLMSENGGRGRWLSADEAIAAGLADAAIKAERAVNDAADFAEEWSELSETFEMLGLPPIPGFASSARAGVSMREGSAEACGSSMPGVTSVCESEAYGSGDCASDSGEGEYAEGVDVNRRRFGSSRGVLRRLSDALKSLAGIFGTSGIEEASRVAKLSETGELSDGQNDADGASGADESGGLDVYSGSGAADRSNGLGGDADAPHTVGEFPQNAATNGFPDKDNAANGSALRHEAADGSLTGIEKNSAVISQDETAGGISSGSDESDGEKVGDADGEKYGESGGEKGDPNSNENPVGGSAPHGEIGGDPAYGKATGRNLPQDKSTLIEQPDRQASAMPTLTAQKEDPSISGDYRRTANELAYENDVCNIRSY